MGTRYPRQAEVIRFSDKIGFSIERKQAKLEKMPERKKVDFERKEVARGGERAAQASGLESDAREEPIGPPDSQHVEHTDVHHPRLLEGARGP
jgi:hypothetical protein